MCGICGWLDPRGVDLKTMVSMSRLASHRGPDGEGYWLHDRELSKEAWFGKDDLSNNLSWKGTLGLGHQRLAIIDLSEAGLQPMASLNGQQWVVFNGEIYNYLELRT